MRCVLWWFLCGVIIMVIGTLWDILIIRRDPQIKMWMVVMAMIIGPFNLYLLGKVMYMRIKRSLR